MSLARHPHKSLVSPGSDAYVAAKGCLRSVACYGALRNEQRVDLLEKLVAPYAGGASALCRQSSDIWCHPQKVHHFKRINLVPCTINVREYLCVSYIIIKKQFVVFVVYLLL